MSGFVSVKLSPVGRPQMFVLPESATEAGAASQPPLSPGQAVIVETGQGTALGHVTPHIPVLSGKREPPRDTARTVVRVATREDVALRARQEQREREAFRVCAMMIRERGLGMKLTRVEQLFDGSRLVFYYTAEERVDFRELVRELAAHFHMRIEMRQIGVRDEARLLAGYGPCGQPLCCSTWLTSFEPVTIKMAKQQNLSLSPSRLSGMCGRLKCCLRYEMPNGKGAQQGGCSDEGGCGDSFDEGCGGCGARESCGCRR